MAEVSLAGGCLCGAVRYRITKAPIDAGYCHCRICQRSSGAPTLAWLTVAVNGFAYTRGKPGIYGSSERSQREFCSDCGTQLVFTHSHTPKTKDVTLASLDSPEAVVPQYHVWVTSQLAWFDIADALPRFVDDGPDTHDA